MVSNTYVVFGMGSTPYEGLGPANPPFPTLFLGASDHSYQRVFSRLDASGDTFRVLYEGNSTTEGTGGDPGIQLEVAFSAAGAIEVHTGPHTDPNGVTGLSNGAGGWIVSPSVAYPALQPYSSYFLSGFGAGDAQNLPWPEPNVGPPPGPPEPLVLGEWASIYTYAEGVSPQPYSLQLPFAFPVNDVRARWLSSFFALPLPPLSFCPPRSTALCMKP